MGTTQDLRQRALIDHIWNTTGDIVTLERDEYPVSNSLGNDLPGCDWRGNRCRYAMFHELYLPYSLANPLQIIHYRHHSLRRIPRLAPELYRY